MDLSPDKFRVEHRPTRSGIHEGLCSIQKAEPSFPGVGFGLFATKFCPVSAVKFDS